MKKFLPACFRGLICSVALLCMHFSTYASHIVGCDLFYTWITGNQYRVTVILYGNCGPASASAFSTLPSSAPQVCVFDANISTTSPALTLSLPIQAPTAGVEITPVCPADSNASQCWISSSTIPGIKKFVYSTVTTLPHTSTKWVFVYTGGNGPGSAAGRAASITNLNAPGSSLMQLIDTLDNAGPGIYSHNTSPLLTVVPTPFFCLNNTDCYNPGALDPDGDSLRFALVQPTNGSGGGCTIGGVYPYLPGGMAWPGQPLSPGTPLQSVLAPPSYYFDVSTGQICFFPTVTQRSVVVYNVSEYRNDTFMGSCQREMTFVVLTCTNTAPVSSIASLSGVIFDDSTHYHICGNAGAWCVSYGAAEPDTANHITLTVTGLTAGMTYTVVANGTNHPVVTICGNTATMPPGLYNFFLHMQDDNCPLSGVNVQAYSINIYPVPTIRDSLVSEATCFLGAVIYHIPGGTGKPWTIAIFHGPGDTIKRYVDSVMVLDTLAPTVAPIADTIVIYTNVSQECSIWHPIVINPPPAIVPVTSFTNPTYCGAKDGSITLSNLDPSVVDTVRYDFNGVPQTLFYGTVSPGGTLGFPNPPIPMVEGTYDNIVVTYGFCHSEPLGPINLVNPPFPIRSLSSINPNRCGACNGAITLYGLNPNQLDTITYTLNGTPTSVSYYVGPDSMVLFTALCDGDTYGDLWAHTAGTCSTAHLTGVTMTGPKLNDTFSTLINYGCHGDTVVFTNANLSDSDRNLTYRWYFGDGYTDTAQNPYHIYFDNQTDTAYIVKLYATNGVCVDSFFHNLKLLNYIAASYSFTPAPYVCQHTPVNFTNTSISLSPPDSAATTYLWTFGNGNSSVGSTPVNTYANTGTYTVTLIETNFVPCSDTFSQTIVVDTISGINILFTDTAICRGKDITFTALYAEQGSTDNVWSVSNGNVVEGFTMKDVNPVVHGFDQAGTYVVSVTAHYRACPETTATRSINVYSYPQIYLGRDTSICPGSTAIILSDEQNKILPGTKWNWSTGDSSSQITVVRPGYYYAVATINGCSSSDTVWVQNDCYMDIPNVFTPNGDGVNDYFFPRQLLTRGMTSFNMNIYNRWGQLMYQATSLDGRGWDGNFNDVPQPGSVYVYIIDATFKDGQHEHHQGNVTLLR